MPHATLALNREPSYSCNIGIGYIHLNAVFYSRPTTSTVRLKICKIKHCELDTVRWINMDKFESLQMDEFFDRQKKINF